MTPIPPIPPIAPMPFMPAGPIGASAGASDGAGPAPAAAPGFASILQSAVAGLNDQMVNSERLSERVATGGVADPTSALVEVEKADLAFNAAVQVRNKLVEGWQELSRMQV